MSTFDQANKRLQQKIFNLLKDELLIQEVVEELLEDDDFLRVYQTNLAFADMDEDGNFDYSLIVKEIEMTWFRDPITDLEKTFSLWELFFKGFRGSDLEEVYLCCKTLREQNERMKEVFRRLDAVRRYIENKEYE